MLTDGEFAELERRGEQNDEPLGTVAYKIVAASLARSAARKRK